MRLFSKSPPAVDKNTRAKGHGCFLVARTTETWNEIVEELKAWAAFARDLQVSAIVA